MITVHPSQLEQLKISPDELVFLTLLEKEDYSTLKSIYDLLTINESKLVFKGYLRLEKDKSNIEDKFLIRPKFSLDTKSDEDRMWFEVCSAYPHKVPSPQSGEYRVLHTKDPEAASNKSLKKKYLKVIKKDKVLHEKVLNAVKAELYLNRNKLQYLQNFSTWINQLGWEKYMDIDVGQTSDVVRSVDTSTKNSSIPNYGNKVK